MPKGESVQVSLKKFKCKEAMSTKFVSIIVGKRKTGKSVVIGELMYYLSKQKVPRACVFSATEEGSENAFFSNHVPDSFIFGINDIESRLTAMYQNQQELQIKKKLGHIPRDTDLRILIVLDDIGFDRKILNCNIIQEIIMNGRHRDILLIISLQNLMQLSSQLRSNCDYIICLKEAGNNILKNLYNNFFAAFEKQSQFKIAFDACTANYGCMVKDNTSNDPTVDGSICWYKATPGRNFKLGSKEFWNYHNERYLSEEDRYVIKQAKKGDSNQVSDRTGSFTVKREK